MGLCKFLILKRRDLLIDFSFATLTEIPALRRGLSCLHRHKG